MQEDKISNGAGAFLCSLVLLTNGFSVLSGNVAGENAWLSHIIASAAAVVCAMFFARLCDLNPQKTFYEAISGALGNFAARVIAIVFAFSMLTTCVVSLTVFSRFVQITALPQTPQIILPLLVSIIAALSLRKGIRATAGAACLLFWFCLAVFVLFLLLGFFGDKNSGVFSKNVFVQNTVIGAAEIFINRFGQIPALMSVYMRMKGENNRKKYFIASIAGSGLAMSAICAITVATLGMQYSALDFYPVYTAMSVRGIGGFIQHTEIFSCVVMTLCLFFKTSVCVLFAQDMLSGVFKINQSGKIALPISLGCAAATQIIYRNTSALRGMVEWKNTMWWIVLPMLLLPILIFGFGKLSERKKRKQGGFHRN